MRGCRNESKPSAFAGGGFARKETARVKEMANYCGGKHSRRKAPLITGVKEPGGAFSTTGKSQGVGDGMETISLLKRKAKLVIWAGSLGDKRAKNFAG